MTTSPKRAAARWAVVLAVLASAHTAYAETGCEKREAPGLFVDLFASTRIYPNADAALIGFATGAVWRPTDKCLHIAGEGFARFGSRSADTGEIKMRTAGGAAGALWGNGDAERWFGAGAMFDLGWAGIGPRDHFAMSGYMRALLYWRLRKEFWIGLDARVGHVIVPVTFEGVGIKGPLVGLGIGAMWGEGSYGER